MQASRRWKMMGTVIDLLIEAEGAESLLDLAQERLEAFELMFSANRSDSDLGMVNQAAGERAVAVPKLLYDLIKRGKEESLLPDSNLNIALGPVVQTWRIGFSDASIPAEKEILQALALTDPEGIILNDAEQTVFLAKPGMKIDLGALAKGYFADLILAELVEKGACSAMINLGGNVLVTGQNPKRDNGLWYIGVQDPKSPRGKHLGILTISEQSVVTSGIYERKLEIYGKSYHHIFDKRTGYPIASDMASLTIVADSSLDCEVWTTKLFGKSCLEAFQQIEQAPHIEGILVTVDGKLVVTSGLRESFD